MASINVGIDVGKDELAVALLPDGESFIEVNDERAVSRLVKRLGALGCERIVLEASGGYETPVVGALAAAGLPVTVVNPRQVREFFGLARSFSGRPIDRPFLIAVGGLIGSGKSALAGAIRYALTRWNALLRYLADGRLEMSNNAAERGMRAPVLGRKNYLFCGSDAGGQRAACVYTIVESAKMCGINPQAYLTDVLGRIADHPINKIDALLPWLWTQ